mmetsp:Transcript_10214/g.24364  ORF Transcript_10214/g.24364 Transcript_10214/m.24364 type:complete len:216 (-) Transcript_10214:692-1339(-)
MHAGNDGRLLEEDGGQVADPRWVQHRARQWGRPPEEQLARRFANGPGAQPPHGAHLRKRPHRPPSRAGGDREGPRGALRPLPEAEPLQRRDNHTPPRAAGRHVGVCQFHRLRHTGIRGRQSAAARGRRRARARRGAPAADRCRGTQTRLLRHRGARLMPGSQRLFGAGRGALSSRGRENRPDRAFAGGGGGGPPREGAPTLCPRAPSSAASSTAP